MTDSLSRHITSLTKTLDELKIHRNAKMEHIPEDYKISAKIIFEHHILNYQAETTWAEQAWNVLKGDEAYEKSRSH